MRSQTPRMAIEDVSNLGLHLGLGFPSTTVEPVVPRKTEHLKPVKGTFEPFLSLAVSGESHAIGASRKGEGTGDKAVADNSAGPTESYGRQASPPHSTVSSFSSPRVKRERGLSSEEVEVERVSSKASDEDDADGVNARKKLRLTKEQSALLEESFKADQFINRSNMASASASAASYISSFRSSSSPAASSRCRPPATRVAFRRRQLRVSASCASTAERPARTHIGSSCSLYEVLQIPAGATCQEIKAAYRRLARVLHPDVAPASSDCSGREFMRLHEAYATLSDPQKRADYDQALSTRRRRVCPPFTVSMSAAASAGGSMNSGFQAYSRRRWETDQCW